MAKKTIICDTDVMIDYWNKNSQRYATTKNALENIIGLDNVMLSAITNMELVIGARDKAELNRINKNIHQFGIALIGDNITLSAIQLLQTYKLSHGLAMPDAIIAATSIVLGFELFTHNTKDYKFIDGLKLYSAISV